MPVIELDRSVGPGVDALLGPGEKRYFGAGYRRVLHDIQDLRSDREAGTAHATARLAYPGDWSAKGRSALRPHLSSIDALVLGAAICEAELAGSGLAQRSRDRAWLRAVTIRAGRSPAEDLDAVEVAARRTARAPGLLQALCTEYDVRIGPMKLRFEIEHGDAGDSDSRPTTSLAALFTDDHHYLSGYKRRRQEISALSIDVAGGRLGADVRVVGGAREGLPAAAESGLEGFYQPSVTMIDAIVVTAQLAQIFLYELDGVPRSRSKTMWLREISLRSATPYQPTSQRFEASIDVAKAPLIPLAGEVYRTGEADYRVHGIRGRFKIAHALPPDHPEALRLTTPTNT
jgi:hypothetical protein